MYYRNDQDQLSLEEFSLPFGGRLLRNNRWVRLAGLIPWEYIEEILCPKYEQWNLPLGHFIPDCVWGHFHQGVLSHHRWVFGGKFAGKLLYAICMNFIRNRCLTHLWHQWQSVGENQTAHHWWKRNTRRECPGYPAVYQRCILDTAYWSTLAGLAGNVWKLEKCTLPVPPAAWQGNLGKDSGGSGGWHRLWVADDRCQSCQSASRRRWCDSLSLLVPQRIAQLQRSWLRASRRNIFWPTMVMIW